MGDGFAGPGPSVMAQPGGSSNDPHHSAVVSFMGLGDNAGSAVSEVTESEDLEPSVNLVGYPTR